MELGPWAPCIDRLATTPEEARALLADAVAILEARAALLAERLLRVWEPTPDMPALIILIDEYAELVDEAPEAIKDADSVARRGRAVAVNLIAATQRPTQKAMGQGAVRSQMDIRVCFRVRERKDVDLILGQGMLAAGWNAHALNAPGKFRSRLPSTTRPAAPAPTCSPTRPSPTPRAGTPITGRLWTRSRPPRLAHPPERGPQIPMMARTGPIRRAGAVADASQTRAPCCGPPCPSHLSKASRWPTLWPRRAGATNGSTSGSALSPKAAR